MELNQKQINAIKDSGLKTKVMGIDPGFTGAIAIYDCLYQKLHAIHDIPIKIKTKRRTKILKMVDISALGFIFDMYKEETEIAAIEKVGAMPGQGVVSMFRFGQGFGILEAALELNGIPVHYLMPSVWKNSFGLGADKNKSLALATKKFPEFRSYFLRKKDDGRAEAALMSLIAVKIFEQRLQSVIWNQENSS